MNAVALRGEEWQCLGCGLIHPLETSARECAHRTCPSCEVTYRSLAAAKTCYQSHTPTDITDFRAEVSALDDAC